MSQREQTSTAEPTWEIAQLFPNQGQWSEEEYLALSTNRLVEFSDGTIEVLPMPSIPHQNIFLFLLKLLIAYVERKQQGAIFPAPAPLRLRSGKYREPDIAFMVRKKDVRVHRQFIAGADLVMEIVSPDNPARDYETKRAEYAEAGILEYGIVDPQMERIMVLKLAGQAYETHGIFQRGDVATSVLLDGFSVDVEAMLVAGEDI
jgi:Uma2 family endonuclease